MQCLSVLDVLISMSQYSRCGDGIMCRPEIVAIETKQEVFYKLMYSIRPLIRPLTTKAALLIRPLTTKAAPLIRPLTRKTTLFIRPDFHCRVDVLLREILLYFNSDIK